MVGRGLEVCDEFMNCRCRFRFVERRYMAHIGYDDASKVWFHLSHAIKGSLAQHIRQSTAYGQHRTRAKRTIEGPKIRQLAALCASSCRLVLELPTWVL